MRLAGLLAALTASVTCFHPLALAIGKLPSADAYNERLKAIANKALHSALMKHPDRLNGVTMKIHYVVDRDGHVHNVKVMSRTHDSSAEKIVADTLAAITFPPIPVDAQLEVGSGYFELEAEVTLVADALTASKIDAPPRTTTTCACTAFCKTTSRRRSTRRITSRLTMNFISTRKVTSPA